MVLFYILLVIAAFLNVILFFKVWNMCDNVAKITDKLCCSGENANITNTICNSDATTETQEQITEQNSLETQSKTDETNYVTLWLIFVFLCLIFLLMIFMC